jgi:hypothetical protein
MDFHKFAFPSDCAMPIQSHQPAGSCCESDECDASLSRKPNFFFSTNKLLVEKITTDK